MRDDEQLASGALFHVRIVRTPALLLVRASEYLQDLLRELQLVRGGSEYNPSQHAPTRLLELIDVVLTRYVGAWHGSLMQAEAALASGKQFVDIRLDLPQAAIAAGEQFLDLFHELAEFARRGALLTLPPAPEIEEFQGRWIDCVVTVLRSGGGEIVYDGATTTTPLTARPVPRSDGIEVLPSPLSSPRTMWAQLPGDLRAPSTVRRLLLDCLASWGHPHVAELASLPASELVANAVLHAGEPLQVGVLMDDSRVRLEVRDPSIVPPVRHLHDIDDATGRGLDLVEALSTRWGFAVAGTGKSVWFELDLAAMEDEAVDANSRQTCG